MPEIVGGQNNQSRTPGCEEFGQGSGLNPIEVADAVRTAEA
jgi:hypothetical protein